MLSKDALHFYSTPTSTRMKSVTLIFFLTVISSTITVCSSLRKKQRQCLQPVEEPMHAPEPGSSCPFLTVPETICHGSSCSVNDMDTCTIANLAILAEFDIFDVVLLHSDSCLGEIPQGDLLYDTLETSILRPEELIGIALNGSDLLAAMEEGFHEFYDNGETGLYPKASGIRFHINPEASFGNRIRNPEIMNRDCVWKKVKPWKIYDIVTVPRLIHEYGSLSKTRRSPMPSRITIPQAVNGHAQRRGCSLQNPFQREKRRPAEVTNFTSSASI